MVDTCRLGSGLTRGVEIAPDADRTVALYKYILRILIMSRVIEGERILPEVRGVCCAITVSSEKQRSVSDIATSSVTLRSGFWNMNPMTFLYIVLFNREIKQ